MYLLSEYEPGRCRSMPSLTAPVAFTTLTAGWYDTGVYHGCSLNSTTVVSTGWTRFYCTFIRPQQAACFRQLAMCNDGGAKPSTLTTCFLQETSTVYSWNEGGSISLIGNVVSPASSKYPK